MHVWSPPPGGFLFFVALLFIPESPRFLVVGGKREKALKVLQIKGKKLEAMEG